MFITPEEVDAQLEDLAHYMEYHDLTEQAEEICNWEKKETKMEIPTKEVIKNLCSLCTRSNESTLTETIATINAQSREILELQATICRLRNEMQTHYNEEG